MNPKEAEPQEELQLFSEAAESDTGAIPVVGEPGGGRHPHPGSDPETGIIGRILESLQWPATPTTAKVMIAGQLALIFGLAVMVAFGRDDAGAPTSGTTGAQPGPAAVSVGDLSLTFAPGSTEADIRTLLLDNQIRLVSGPSALGLYQAALAPGSDLDQVLAAMSSSPIVLFVQAMPQP